MLKAVISAFFGIKNKGGKMKKIFCLIMAVFMITAAVPVTAAETEKTYSTLMYNDRRSETVNFEVEFTFDDAWLSDPSGKYNHSLAKALAALSGAAYVDVKPDNLASTLEKMGFERESMIAAYPVPTEEDNDTVGYIIAKKTVGDKDIVAVITKGTSEDAEWYSNFNIGSGDTHAGFLTASESVWESLRGFMADVRENVSFMITGHSRGAAVANIIASRLVDAGYDSVHAYTFASPLVSTKACEEGYENIFNIISGTDFVTRLPVAQWGYKRYGKDLFIPSKNFYEPDAYKNMLTEVSEMYASYTEKTYTPFEGSVGADDLSRYLFSIADVKDDFYDKKLYKSVTERATLDEFFNAMASALVGSGDLSQTIKFLEYDIEFAPINYFFINNHLLADRIFSAHSMSSYYSWLCACEEGDLVSNEDFIRIRISGNADTEVYDKDGNIRAAITAGEITKNDIAVNNLGDGKYFDIPAGGYSIKISSPDMTTVNISAEKLITSKTDIPVWAKDYYGIPLSPGESIEMAVNESVILTKSNGEISPTYDLEGEIPLCTVRTQSAGSGVCYGGGKFRKGDSITVYAVSNETEEFVGWYNGENLVSEDPVYTFPVDEDVVLFAQFAHITHIKGDLNSDSIVNSDDLSLLLGNYLSDAASCDIDDDGKVTSTDLSILLFNFGESLE